MGLGAGKRCAGTHQHTTAIKSTSARKAPNHLAYGFSCKSVVIFLVSTSARVFFCASLRKLPVHLIRDCRRAPRLRAASSPGPWAGAEAPACLGSTVLRSQAGRLAADASPGSAPHPAGWALPSRPNCACVQTAHPLWKGGSLNVAQIIAGTQANCRLLLAHKLSGTFEIDPHYPKRHP